MQLSQYFNYTYIKLVKAELVKPNQQYKAGVLLRYLMMNELNDSTSSGYPDFSRKLYDIFRINYPRLFETLHYYSLPISLVNLANLIPISKLDVICDEIMRGDYDE